MKNIPSQVLLVLIDGLKYATALEHMPFLEGAVDQGLARRWKMRGRMPSLSRPMYETIHTGVDADEHGILNNTIVRRSRCAHIFGVARAHGRRTGAAALSYFHELYNGGVFDPARHGDIADPSLTVQYAHFYENDDYPDADLFSAATALVERHRPDYMLVHSLAVDDTGHAFGGEARQYAAAARQADALLSATIPNWREFGYRVIVTSDHGMKAEGRHGGDTQTERMVPFYLFDGDDGGAMPEIACQLSVMPTVLSLMGLPIPEAAKAAPLE